MSRGGGFYARQVLDVPVQDLTGGYKVFRREVLEALPLDEIRSEGYCFQIEMTHRAFLQGFRIKEVPINWYFDADSKVSAVRDAIKMVSDIFRIHLNSLRGRYDLNP